MDGEIKRKGFTNDLVFLRQQIRTELRFGGKECARTMIRHYKRLRRKQLTGEKVWKQQ